MQTRRWTNPYLPQSLQIAIILLYISAFFGILNGLAFSGVLLLIGVAAAAAGFGIANTKKWGWRLGIAATSVELLPLLLALPGRATDVFLLASLIFVGARLALLLQPESREHVRVWFE